MALSLFDARCIVQNALCLYPNPTITLGDAGTGPTWADIHFELKGENYHIILQKEGLNNDSPNR